MPNVDTGSLSQENITIQANSSMFNHPKAMSISHNAPPMFTDKTIEDPLPNFDVKIVQNKPSKITLKGAKAQ